MKQADGAEPDENRDRKILTPLRSSSTNSLLKDKFAIFDFRTNQNQCVDAVDQKSFELTAHKDISFISNSKGKNNKNQECRSGGSNQILLHRQS